MGVAVHSVPVKAWWCTLEVRLNLAPESAALQCEHLVRMLLTTVCLKQVKLILRALEGLSSHVHA